MKQLSEFVSSKLGLYYREERWGELEEAFLSALPDLGVRTSATWAQELLSKNLDTLQVQALASHLTVGETYFFRDKPALEALEANILPPLIHAHQNDRILRIWSAGCCSGEEPYTIAIILTRLLPDIADWKITLLGTDVNPVFLKKAERAVYGPWSFRETPASLHDRYFNKTGDGRFELLPSLRSMVTFSYLNLVEDCFPSLTTNTNAMDLILCRNVLMYFSRNQANRILREFSHCLMENGILMVSPSDVSQDLAHFFTPVNVARSTVYRKARSGHTMARAAWTPTYRDPATQDEVTIDDADGQPLQNPVDAGVALVHPADELPTNEADQILDDAQDALENGDYEKAVETLVGSLSQNPHDSRLFALLAHVYANLGSLVEAADVCQSAIMCEKLNASYHYLLGSIRLAEGDFDRAVESFRNVLYLNGQFVLAHFALGNIFRKKGANVHAQKYYRNTLALLEAIPPQQVLPEAEGMTAGRLKQIVESILFVEQAL